MWRPVTWSSVIGVLASMIMLGSDSGRAQVLTSLIAAGALALFWPIVRRNLQKARAANALPPAPEQETAPVG